MGHIPGGLGYVAIGASLMLASMSGSAIADTAALATLLLPMMRKQNYPAGPSAGLIASGGIMSGRDAIEFLMAGASAVQIGTATFRDPNAPWSILDELTAWCEAEGVHSLSEIIGVARHRD